MDNFFGPLIRPYGEGFPVSMSTMTVISSSTITVIISYSTTTVMMNAAPSMYSGTDIQSVGSLAMWQSVRTTNTGIATFYPTTTGDSSGTSLFQTIQSVSLTAKANVAAAVSMPTIALKSIAVDCRSFTANAVTGTVLGILGATVLFAPDGTEIMAVVWGSAYS